jgi:hypothetical protein
VLITTEYTRHVSGLLRERVRNTKVYSQVVFTTSTLLPNPTYLKDLNGTNTKQNKTGISTKVATA